VKKDSETKSEVASNNHTTVQRNTNNMKTNTEMNINAQPNPISTPTPNTRRGKGLKALVVALSMLALGLSYRAATEAVALYGVLEKVHATWATEQGAQAQPNERIQISETKPAVSGL
jgi:hypothetical protein